MILIGCRSEKIPSSKDQKASKTEAYPAKVTRLLALIQDLKPETNVHTWIDLVDKTIALPEEDQILDGGGGLGEIWLTIGIGAGDEWALSIESYYGSEFIWEAMVVKTSVSKAIANEPHEYEVIYPHYYQGHMVSNEEEKIQIRKQRSEKLYRQNETQ